MTQFPGIDPLRLLLHGDIDQGGYVALFKRAVADRVAVRRERVDSERALREVGITPDPHGQRSRRPYSWRSR